MLGFAHEVEDHVEVAKNNFDRYCFEKNMAKKTLIIKQSDYTCVKRLINNVWSSKHSFIEWDTVFKLFKLQHYVIDMNYFKGTKYSSTTLNNFKWLIKSASLGGYHGGYRNKATFHAIASFIDDIRSISKPFPANLVSGKRRKISDLLKACITKEDKEFILSSISPSRERKEKVVEEPAEVRIFGVNELLEENKENQTMIKPAKQEKEHNYQIIIDNWNKPSKEVAELIPTMAKKSVMTYLGYVRAWENGSMSRKSGTTTLYNMWSASRNNKPTVSVETKTSTKVESKTTAKVTTYNDDFIIMDNNNKIIKTGVSKDYLLGFKEAMETSNPEITYKVYQLVS